MKTKAIAAALVSCAISSSFCGQSTHSRPAKSNPWDEGKLIATAQAPFISDHGFLVLPYTVTNESGQDVELNFKKSTFQLREPDRLYLLLKDSNSLQQIDPDHDSLVIYPSLLPSELPIRMTIVVGTGKYSDSTIFESDKSKLSRAMSEQLGNVSRIVILIPSIHAKLNLPVRTTR